MSGHKKSLRLAPSTGPSSASTQPETATCENQQILKYNQLSEKNAQLAQEVQKLKLTNGQLVRRVIELSRKNHEASSDNVRLREAFKRISRCLENFVPCMVTGTQYLDCIAGELDKVSVPITDTFDTSPVVTDEDLEDINGGGIAPVSPLRTGIARPIVQGHTISKPSISLQRVVPRQTATHYIPMPVRSLNLADLVRADDENRLLSDVAEEGDNESREENGGTGESEENETDENRSDSRSGSDGSSNPANENGPLELSMVDEESSIADESRTQLSVLVEQSIVMSPVIEEQASTSEAATPSPSAKKSKNKSVLVEEPAESSDDEEIELSLIEARCRLLNPGRRKELKEGTSKDYDERGNFSPRSRRRRKRKEEELSPTREENETSALRRSVSGLLNSIKKGRVSKNKRLSDAGDSPVAAGVNGFGEDMANPRVSLVRISAMRNPVALEPDGLDETVIEELPDVPPSPMVMVSSRKRRSYVTTRNKRSRLNSVEDIVIEEPAPIVEEPPRRSEKRRRSWSELMRKRLRSQEAEVSEDETVEKASLPSTLSPRLPASSPRPTSSPRRASSPRSESSSRVADELPTIRLSRCSESFIAHDTPKELPSSSSCLNDDFNSSSDTPLSQLMSRTGTENVFNSGNTPNKTSAPKQAKAKPRSKPKRPSRPTKAVNGKKSQETRTSKRSVNGFDSNESQGSLNPSLINSSVASSIGERDNSCGSPSRVSATGRPRRATAPTSLKERPLNVKMRRV